MGRIIKEAIKLTKITFSNFITNKYACGTPPGFQGTV
jgi:hypothetical protein